MRTDWIKQLKQDDQVIISSSTGQRVATVQKVTPSGRILANGLYFNPDGYERGATGYGCCCLLEATIDKVNAIFDAEIINDALKLMRKTNKITVKQANDIIYILMAE